MRDVLSIFVFPLNQFLKTATQASTKKQNGSAALSSPRNPPALKPCKTITHEKRAISRVRIASNAALTPYDEPIYMEFPGEFLERRAPKLSRVFCYLPKITGLQETQRR